ncbi:DUF4097 family beta strand repeat-containing protein [Nocardioides litoris]|uniref:DUF4097 family beta strand repeat-containing protein n=1 Tax=Nocardioides litoris TaxID=1926648 RepID=UPI00112234B9|nr:DUF4097 family beta strand repeat-containing protein [Nocardioides litoris]
MTDQTEHHFETHEPVELYVENGRGTVEVRATDTTETTVHLEGPEAEHVRVELDGRLLSVVAPERRSGLFSGDRALDVVITLPSGSAVGAKLGSADLRVTGSTSHAQVRSGSGDVSFEALTDTAVVETGSGDVRVGAVGGDLRIKSGSGDVTLDTVSAAVAASTGSGGVAVRESTGALVVKTGSGDLVVGRTSADVGLTTGSGDARVDLVTAGTVRVKGASSDVRVGVAGGVPVWTDVSSLTGSIRSDLVGAGKPGPDQQHVEIRAVTVSGDVVLEQR